MIFSLNGCSDLKSIEKPYSAQSGHGGSIWNHTNIRLIEIRFVFINLLNDYATVCQALVSNITCKEQGSNSRDKGKAEKC